MSAFLALSLTGLLRSAAPIAPAAVLERQWATRESIGWSDAAERARELEETWHT